MKYLFLDSVNSPATKKAIEWLRNNNFETTIVKENEIDEDIMKNLILNIDNPRDLFKDNTLLDMRLSEVLRLAADNPKKYLNFPITIDTTRKEKVIVVVGFSKDTFRQFYTRSQRKEKLIKMLAQFWGG